MPGRTWIARQVMNGGASTGPDKTAVKVIFGVGSAMRKSFVRLAKARLREPISERSTTSP